MRDGERSIKYTGCNKQESYLYVTLSMLYLLSA